MYFQSRQGKQTNNKEHEITEITQAKKKQKYMMNTYSTKTWVHGADAPVGLDQNKLKGLLHKDNINDKELKDGGRNIAIIYFLTIF